MRCCWGYLSGARCRLFAFGPADATAIPKLHHLLPHLNRDWFYLSGMSLPRLSCKKRPLNWCSSSSCCCCWYYSHCYTRPATSQLQPLVLDGPIATGVVWSVCLSGCVSLCWSQLYMSPVKTAESISTLFLMWTLGAKETVCYSKVVKYTDVAVCKLTCHTTVGTHMPSRLTECYLPPNRGDILTLTPAVAGTWLSDCRGMQG